MTMNDYLNKKKDYLNKKKEFEFYILNINKQTLDYDEIIDIFLDVIINPFVYEENNYTFVLSNIINNDVSQVVSAIVEDFGYNLKVFRSNKIYTQNMDDFNILKDSYLKNQVYINDNYVNIQKLLYAILEKNMDDLQTIKPVILRKINNDSKLYEIVNGMFVNDLNVCKTANYVYMHRNTINNKLITIKEETGLDIQKFQDAVMLYVLLKKKNIIFIVIDIMYSISWL